MSAILVITDKINNNDIKETAFQSSYGGHN